MNEQLTLFDAVSANGLPEPKPAKCPKCGCNWTGRDAIVSPTLANCCCFWCDAPLRPHRGQKDFAVEDLHHETRRGKCAQKIWQLTRRGGYVMGEASA